MDLGVADPLASDWPRWNAVKLGHLGSAGGTSSPFQCLSGGLEARDCAAANRGDEREGGSTELQALMDIPPCGRST